MNIEFLDIDTIKDIFLNPHNNWDSEKIGMLAQEVIYRRELEAYLVRKINEIRSEIKSKLEEWENKNGSIDRVYGED